MMHLERPADRVANENVAPFSIRRRVTVIILRNCSRSKIPVAAKQGLRMGIVGVSANEVR
jgi:hypothetical protein